MPRFDATTARCTVFTLKEGTLSAVAHDLELAVDRFAIEVDAAGATLTAWFDPRSLRVVSARRGQERSPGTLGAVERSTIVQNIARDVLPSGEHVLGRGRLEETEAGYRLEGTLTIEGVERPLVAEIGREPGALVGRVRIDQRDFGIRPYSAFFGTLKVQAVIEVEVRVAVPG